MYGGGWGMAVPLFILLMLWSLLWKGLALWHSAKRGEKWWFIAMLVINTVGILEIIYLFLVAKMKLSDLFGPRVPKV
jgi:hypothetical protein